MRPNNFHGSHSKTSISADLREHKRRGKPFIEQTQPKQNINNQFLHTCYDANPIQKVVINREIRSLMEKQQYITDESN